MRVGMGNRPYGGTIYPMTPEEYQRQMAAEHDMLMDADQYDQYQMMFGGSPAQQPVGSNEMRPAGMNPSGGKADRLARLLWFQRKRK